MSAEHAKKDGFDHVLHQSTTESQGGLRSMLGKNQEAQSAAVGEYFQHWDHEVEEDTDDARQSRTLEYASITRQSVHLSCRP